MKNTFIFIAALIIAASFAVGIVGVARKKNPYKVIFPPIPKIGQCLKSLSNTPNEFEGAEYNYFKVVKLGKDRPLLYMYSEYRKKFKIKITHYTYSELYIFGFKAVDCGEVIQCVTK